jgi:phosphatidylinositol alpha-1,6-mannosyltransferase
MTAAVLAAFAAQRNESYTFLSLNDPVAFHTLRIGAQEFSFDGFGRSKARFLFSALGAALRRPSLVIALHPNLGPIVTATRFCAPPVRTVIFAHGIEVWTPLGRMRERALRNSDLVIAPSNDTARQLRATQGVAEERIRRVAWSLGPEFGVTTASKRFPPLPRDFPRGRVILTVGRWDAAEAYKGVDHLIAAMPALVKATPDAQLVAIGSGSDLPRLNQLAQQSGVAGNIHFLQALEQEELLSAYNSCDIFALPSGGEGFGLVFLEAMAHGKPVVGGAHGGTPDIIEDGVSGYLVQHGNVPQLTARLHQLLTDEVLAQRMGAKALERVRLNYTFERFSRELDALWAALLEGR